MKPKAVRNDPSRCRLRTFDPAQRKLGFEWQGAHIFEAADTDADGKVSFAEFLALFGKGAKAQAHRHAHS